MLLASRDQPVGYLCQRNHAHSSCGWGKAELRESRTISYLWRRLDVQSYPRLRNGDK